MNIIIQSTRYSRSSRRLYSYSILSSLKSLFRGRMAVDAKAVAPMVQDMIKSDKVVIFSKTYCPYCKLAKEVFDKLKQPYTAIELDNRDDGAEIQSVLSDITGAKTVPRVFIKGKCYGGGSDVKDLYEKGELQKLVA